MNKFLILSFAALISIGCNSTANQTTTANTNVAVQASNIQPSKDSTVVSSHSHDAEKPVPPMTATTDKPATSTGSPMAQPIDVAAMTADIEKAEKDLAKNPNAKEELAKAYFVRATALTGAAQYRAALGDYRKGLKLNPKDEDAKAMHDQIISIFQSINREPPKEGEEPKPLPVK